MDASADTAFAEAIKDDIAKVMLGLEKFSPPVFGPKGTGIGACAAAIGRDPNATAKRFAQMLHDVSSGREIDISELSEEISRYLPHGLPPNSKAKAGFICMLCVLLILTSCIDALSHLQAGNQPACMECAADANRWSGFMLGILTGFSMNDSVREQGIENGRRAAEGRRLIGSASREKVRKAAEAYRHVARDAAAFPISQEVGLAPGTVRRYLSQLFPGDDWHASADSSQRNS